MMRLRGGELGTALSGEELSYRGMTAAEQRKCKLLKKKAAGKGVAWFRARRGMFWGMYL